jgi:hypothetical protein
VVEVINAEGSDRQSKTKCENEYESNRGIELISGREHGL